MLHSLLTAAAEAGEEPSKTVFYIAGGLLALWAVVISGLGIARHAEFPGSDGAARGIMAISAVLVIAAMATAVITA
jgi:hypothetical protein